MRYCRICDRKFHGNAPCVSKRVPGPTGSCHICHKPIYGKLLSGVVMWLHDNSASHDAEAGPRADAIETAFFQGQRDAAVHSGANIELNVEAYAYAADQKVAYTEGFNLTNNTIPQHGVLK